MPSLLFFSAAKIEPSKVAPAMAAAPEAGPVKVRGLETREFPILIPYSLLVKKVNIDRVLRSFNRFKTVHGNSDANN